MNSGGIERTRTDRCEKCSPIDFVCPPVGKIYSSTFVSDCLAFNVKRKIKTLNCTTKLICNSTKDSTEQLNALKSLATQIVEDTRLADHLDSAVFSHLVEFLGDNKSPQFQYYSALVFENIVPNKGREFKDRSVPYLLKLILSPENFVQMTALFTLANIANLFPESCHIMINNGVLEHLESLISNKWNHYELLDSGCQLLTAFCRMKPQLLSDKMDIVVNTISTAIEYVHESVLIQGCLALSLLSDQGLLKIGTVVDRLLNLIDYPVLQIVISALRTIGNYVRWGNNEEIQFMIRLSLPAVVAELLCHECTIVRKEACWIISNVTAVANISQMQDIYDLGLIDMLLTRVRIDEFDVKEVAACAISNVLYGSDHKLFECIKVEYFPLLDDLRLYFDDYFDDDPRMAALCSKILELDSTYLTEILEPTSLPTKMEEKSSIGAFMTSGTTANLTSASAKNASKKITNKKKSSRRKTTPTASSPLDLLIDIREDLGSEVIVSRVDHLSPDTSTKDLDSEVFEGDSKILKKGKKLSCAAASSELSIVSTEELECKNNTGESDLIRATKHNLSCAGERKSKKGKKRPSRLNISQLS